MKVEKQVSVRGKFAKTGIDFKDGDFVAILDGGQVTQGEYGEQTVFKVKMPKGEELNKAFNQTTMNTLIDAFGNETSRWIGREVRAFVVRAMVSGKLQNIAYFAPDGWAMMDDGSFIRVNDKANDQNEGIKVDDIDISF